MDFGCCANGEVNSSAGYTTASFDSDDSFHDHLVNNNSLVPNTFECDYRDATPLFKAIEHEDWREVLLFLTTSKWGNSALASTFSQMVDPPVEYQVRTWVTCHGGKRGEVQWRQLPIHAAISYLAPLPVVQKLLEFYPRGVRCADDAGNLPLHLAFGFGSPDNVVAFLIKEYPQALSARGLQKRRPVDCCQLGPNKVRGEIIRACQDHTRATMMKDWDNHWKKSLADAKKRAGMEEPYLTDNKTIEEVFDELMQVKIELEKTKELAKNRPTMIITKTEPAPSAAAAATITTAVSPKEIGKSPSDISRIFSFGKLSRKGSSRNEKKSSKTNHTQLPPSRSKKSASVAPATGPTCLI